MLYWVIGFVVSMAGLALYLELASYFPSRSGAEVAYLEQAYPRPKYFFPVAFAVQSVILSFSSSNAIVLATYIFRMAGHTPTAWESKGVAVAGYTVATLFVLLSNKVALQTSNVIGAIKVLTLVFISSKRLLQSHFLLPWRLEHRLTHVSQTVTGLVVLGGHVKSIPDPQANFRNVFEGTTGDGNGLSTALVRITFSYAGYQKYALCPSSCLVAR